MKKNLYLFIIIASLYVSSSLVLRLFYIDDTFFYNSYGGKFDPKQAQEIINLDRTWGFIKFFFIPISLFVRISLVVFCFYLGMYLAEIKASIKDLYKIVIIAEVTFLLFTIIRTALVFNYSFTSFDELGGYAPFRFIPLTKLDDYPVWVRIPMSIINPVEILYWLVLSFLLSRLMLWNYIKSVWFITKTYVLGLSIWILIIVFIDIVLLK